MKVIGHIVGVVGGLFLTIFIWPTVGVPLLAIPILGWISSVVTFFLVWGACWLSIYRLIVDRKLPWQN